MERGGFRHNHYVPEWYQREFFLPGQSKYHYLDLDPERLTENGHTHLRRALRTLGPGNCFAQDDLYTVNWGATPNVDIEKFFFGKLDNDAPAAVKFFANYKPGNVDSKAFQTLIQYMSVQKLRTPKGLAWLGLFSRSNNRNLDLILLQQVENVFCAIWTECVWQIADAHQSPTKFIVSDHPVTVYNRVCAPSSKLCRNGFDPDIRHAATHTIFPLSLNKVLILTNLSWVRNPYQSELTIRPNPGYFRNTIFNFQDIQTFRSLSEEEVRQINYVIKRRAKRYIAAANPEWLYPEKELASTTWERFGDGLLLMPEPREVVMGGQVVIGYKDGSAEAFSEYGHRPWQSGYEDKKRFEIESRALQRFQDEFARKYGAAYRGTANHFHRTEGPYVTPDEFHEGALERDRQRREARRRTRVPKRAPSRRPPRPKDL